MDGQDIALIMIWNLRGRKMLEKRIKKYLEDIIDVAFANDDEKLRQRYKWFKLHILPKENKRVSGYYYENTHVIEVFNPSLGSRHLAKCCLHELSHHIDWCRHGKSGHQAPFYEVYEKLIFASLDMGILQKEDFHDDWSRDKNKVLAILDRYKPHPIAYKTDIPCIIRIFNGFTVKDQLKSAGYRWNTLEQVWEIEVSDLSMQEKYLSSLKIAKSQEELSEYPDPYYVITDPSMHIDGIIYILAQGQTYDAREILKEYGFFFSKEKKWLRKVKASEQKHLLDSLYAEKRLFPYELTFTLQKRK